MVKPRYDTTQLKSHPKRNRKQNELVKAMLKQLDLMLGENHAGEFLAVFVELLKRAVNETPDGKLELRSMEIILNDYFHVKHSGNGTHFKVDEDYKKIKAFEIIKEHEVIVPALLKTEGVSEYNKGWLIKKNEITQDEFDLLKEALK